MKKAPIRRDKEIEKLESINGIGRINSNKKKENIPIGKGKYSF